MFMRILKRLVFLLAVIPCGFVWTFCCPVEWLLTGKTRWGDKCSDWFFDKAERL